jgi:hypothetical protein
VRVLLLLAVIAAPPEGRQLVGRPEILAAMKESAGFDPTATANASRLHAEVVLRLVRAAMSRNPDGPPLFLDRNDWFSAYLERTGLAAAQAPAFARLAREYGQDAEVEYRRKRVLRNEGADPQPAVAANVAFSWSAPAGRGDSYSYEDQRATPRLKATVRRGMSYRLLDLGDMVVYAEIRGLRGRPTSGILGALFDLLGEVPVLESRMAVAADGLQVTRGYGRKLGVDKWVTVTVQPDGRADRGVPAGRPDLLALEERLKRPLRYSFVPLPEP